MTQAGGFVPRPDDQAIEVVACALGPGGVLRITGTINVPGGQRFSDFLNRAEGQVELTGARTEVLANNGEHRRAEVDSLQVNPRMIDMIWTGERRRGGDPALRVALESRMVRAITLGADVVGETRLPRGTTGFGHLLTGHDPFLTLSPVRIESPHLESKTVDGPLELCLVNRARVVALTLEPESAVAELTKTCFRTRCEQPATTACEYADGTGAICGTAWCEGHSRAIGESRYCERHHDVIVALNAAQGTLNQFRPPLVNDRTLSLIQLLFKAMDPEVVALLEPLRQQVDGAVVSVDQHVRHQILDGGVAWERGWGVAVPQGYLARVLLRVPVGEPPVVKLLVNRREMFSDVPDWIAARRAGGSPTEDDQHRFTAALVRLVSTGLGYS
ncbi:MAG TPA: hypothetical protein VF137_05960 [Candidatus Dormibacteraeota bacterium]